MARALALASVSAAVAALPSGLLTYDMFKGNPYTVTYDNRSIMLNGTRTVFWSAGVHYPRFSPGQWVDTLAKAKADGYNMIQTYVFVNAHSPKNQWPWIMEGNVDLRAFLELARDYNLFVNLRIGPYVCAEWSWGGYPYNLAQIPGLASRSSSAAWEAWMSAVVLNVTSMFSDLFANEGGPIVLAQVENELHTSDDAYVEFCGALAQQANPNIVWEMCNGNSAAYTINSCNGGDCTGFIENNGQNGKVLITQPAMWTENWMGWFSSWGDGGPSGGWPSYDSTGQSRGKSLGIMRWVARGGTHMNFYNWAGGNNYPLSAGITTARGTSVVGGSITPAYYWDAPIASDGLDQGPERLHMARTFAALAQVAPTLLANPAQVHKQVQLPYYAGGKLNPGDGSHIAFVYPGNPSVAFMENTGSGTAQMVWNGVNFTVPSGSSSVVFSNGTILFNSNDVIPLGKTRVWTPVASTLPGWQMWQDPVVPTSPSSIPGPTAPRVPWTDSTVGIVINSALPLEAVNFTEYDSELAVYVTVLDASTFNSIISQGTNTSIKLASAIGQAWMVFANGALVGQGWELSHADGKANIDVNVSLAGINAPVALALVSSSLGIGNGGGINNGNTTADFSSTGVKGITSQAANSVVAGGVDITSLGTWTHISGCAGAAQSVYTTAGGASVSWQPATTTTAPMTWLRVNFTAPASVFASPPTTLVNVTLNLDITGLGRGHFWVNGYDLGRYWTRLCGSSYMCQRYYSIPFDLLLPGPNANQLVLLDETGVTNLSSVTFVTSANTAPPPPPPCAPIPSGGAPAVMTACNTNASLLTAKAGAQGQYTFSLQSVPAGSAGSSFCLGITSMDGPVGSPAVGWLACNTSDPLQSWQLSSTDPTTFAPVLSPALGSNKCLDVANQNSSVGAITDVWSCNGGSNQAWAWNGSVLASGMGDLCLGLC